MIKKAYLSLLRPQQWVKNLIIFFPPFLSGSLLCDVINPLVGVFSFISFCCISSSLYIYNDLNDIERDALHPIKKLRPLASRQISTQHALFYSLSLGSLGFILAYSTSKQMTLYLFIYALISASYTKWFKHIPILDLFFISSGFILRLTAGGVVFNVKISEWLFLSVFFLSLFLSTGKRMIERNMLGENAVNHRTSLYGYPDGTLDSILNITAATALVTYSMYTLTHSQLIYTVPLCTIGIFRYIFIVKKHSFSGDPTDALFKDKILFCVSAFWLILVLWSIYA